MTAPNTMGSTLEPGGFVVAGSASVKPLAPYQSSINAKEIHDSIFGVPAIGVPGQPGYYPAIVGTFEYVTNPVYASVLPKGQAGQIYQVFKNAVAAGIVPNTPTGLETLTGVIGDGPTKAPADFWQWYELQITGGAYNGIAPGQPGSASGPGIINPVTKQFIPAANVLPGYPQTDAYGTTTLKWKDASGNVLTQTYYGAAPGQPNPNTGVATLTGKQDAAIIANVPSRNPGAVYNALRAVAYFTDGSTTDDPPGGHQRPEYKGPSQWTITSATVADLTKTYSPPGRVTVRDWADLSPAERQAVGKDLAVTAWDPNALTVVQPSTSIYSPRSGGGIIDAPVRPDPSLPTQGPNNGVTGVPPVTVFSPTPPPPSQTPTFLPTATTPAPVAGSNAQLWELLGAIAVLFFLL